MILATTCTKRKATIMIWNKLATRNKSDSRNDNSRRRRQRSVTKARQMMAGKDFSETAKS